MTNPIKLKPWFVFNKRIVICQTHPELDYPIKKTLQNGSGSNSASDKILHGLGELSFAITLFSFLITVSTPDKLETWFSEIRGLDSALLVLSIYWDWKRSPASAPSGAFPTWWQYCGHCCLKVNNKWFSQHFCSSPANFCFAVFEPNVESSDRAVALSFQV